MEETKKKEDKKPGEEEPEVLSPLDEIRKEKEELSKIRDEIKEDKEEYKSMKIDEIIRGRAAAGGIKEDKKEESPKEYRARVEKEMASGKTEW